MANHKKNNKNLLIPYYKNPDGQILKFPFIENGTINKAIINNIDSDVVILDNNLNIVFMNNAAEKTFDVKSEEIVGTSYMSLQMRFKEKGALDTLNDVVNTKKIVNIKEIRLSLPDNATKFVDLSYMPIYDDNKNIQGVLSVSRDVTKKVNKDIEFKRAQRLIKDLTERLHEKEQHVDYLQKELKGRDAFHNIIGKNHKMEKLYEIIDTISSTDSTTLITGETGTGKELFAKAIHYTSSRKDNDIIAVNCASLPETLLESELFGHVKGSFTGAIRDKKGKFELADKGTLFLDEVGELSIPTQVKLLRTLQEREIERVGDEKRIKVDIRIIAATNKDLALLIKEGKFRTDLFYRLNVISLKIPPLRERTDDIPLLVEHFIKKFNERFKKGIRNISPLAMKRLMSYNWPGNVRELEGVIEKSVIFEQSDTISEVSIEPVDNSDTPLLTHENKGSYDDLLSHFNEKERDYFIDLFKRFNGRINEISSHTGISRRTILNKMNRFGIKKEAYR